MHQQRRSLSVGINRCDAAPTPTGFAEIVSDDFPELHVEADRAAFISTQQSQNDMKRRNDAGTTFAIAAIALFALRQHRRQSPLNRRVHATTMLLWHLQTLV